MMDSGAVVLYSLFEEEITSMTSFALESFSDIAARESFAEAITYYPGFRTTTIPEYR